MLNWRKLLTEWRHVVVIATQGAPFWWRARFYLISAFKITRAVLSGPVPPEVWQSRIRTCLKCPILDRETMACHKQMPDGTILGCSCFTPFLAITAAPYPDGCWVHQRVSYEGWAAYRFPSRRAKLLAAWRFIFPAK